MFHEMRVIPLLLLAGLVGCATTQQHKPTKDAEAENSDGTLRFVVSFPKSVRATPISGRALLFLSRRERGEPRSDLNWFAPDPVFAIDIKDFQPDDFLVFLPDKFKNPDALAFPGRLDRLESGIYFAQVLIDQDNTRRNFNDGPGNLYSTPVQVELTGSTGPTYELIANQVIEEETHEEND